MVRGNLQGSGVTVTERAKSFITICAAIGLVASIAAGTAKAYEASVEFVDKVQSIKELQTKQIENTQAINEMDERLNGKLDDLLRGMSQLVAPPPSN